MEEPDFNNILFGDTGQSMTTAGISDDHISTASMVTVVSNVTDVLTGLAGLSSIAGNHKVVI